MAVYGVEPRLYSVGSSIAGCFFSGWALDTFLQGLNMSIDRKGLLSGLREYGKLENCGPGSGAPDLGVIIFNAESNIF